MDESSAPKADPTLYELVAYVKEHGASAAARHFNLGYTTVRTRVHGAGLHLRRGRRRNRDLAARNADIRALRHEKMYLKDIGAKYGLGRERIRQILADTGGDPFSREAQQEEARQAVEGEIQALLQAPLPQYPAEEAQAAEPASLLRLGSPETAE